jgi:hypothetical protein
VRGPGDKLSRLACNYIERKYGLVPTSPAMGTASKHPTQSERHKAPPKHEQPDARRAAARARREPARAILRRRVRTAAAAAHGLDDFFARLRADGVLVRPRLRERDPGQITGYAVALTGDTDSNGNPICSDAGSWPRATADGTATKPARSSPGGRAPRALRAAVAGTFSTTTSKRASGNRSSQRQLTPPGR